MTRRVETVGIIGGGPAGLALASFLALRGVEATLFDDGKRPDLLVGESLVPAVVPLLRRLGIEERVAAVSLHKPGVSITMAGHDRLNFDFRNITRCDMPTYSYNVPRPAFDEVLDARATELGAKRVRTRARIERHGTKGLRLAEETLALAPWLRGRQPDLLVDATGRNRLFARTLDIKSDVGPRRDVSYFAHYENFEDNVPRGQVVFGWLDHAGWYWRIPLRDRMSVGIVINKDAAAMLGATPAERLEAAIERDSTLRPAGGGRRRVSEVVSYGNYQLISRRTFGPGWVMAGDAFGFLDPLLSPGVWLALHSGEMLSTHLDDLRGYARDVRLHLRSWMEMIDHYYSGRIFAMYYKGQEYAQKYDHELNRRIQLHFNTRVACMACGANTHHLYGRLALKFFSSRAVWGKRAPELAIR